MFVNGKSTLPLALPLTGLTGVVVTKFGFVGDVTEFASVVEDVTAGGIGSSRHGLVTGDCSEGDVG